MKENTGRLVKKKHCFFCVGEYAEYGFDQQRLIWYDCSDEGLTLETSAKHHIPQATKHTISTFVDETHTWKKNLI